MTKGYGSLLVKFVCYIVISRTTVANVKIVTKSNINLYLLENSRVAFHKKLYLLRKRRMNVARTSHV